MSVDWVLIRATGMTSVVLLTASMVLGLMMSLRITTPRWPGRINYDTHRFVTGAALWTVGAHLVLLMLDSWTDIGLADLVIPFASDTRTFATGLGTLAFVALTVVWSTSMQRKHLGQRAWRSLHYLTFFCYLAAIAHGILGGTDTGQVWAWPVYVASIAVVGYLTARRILVRRPASRSGGPAPTVRPSPERAVRANADPVVLPPLPSQRADPRRAPNAA